MNKLSLRFLAWLLLLPPFAADAQQFKSAWPDTDFSRSQIELSEVMSGGPPRDGIPPIDEPKFDSVVAAAEWVSPLEPVIAVTLNGESRAYPLQILTWHEIVNDSLGGIPLSVTFCPLCNASIVFDRRRPDDVILDFGTTGLLRMSDLIMYDRQTESWWQQFSGKAIVGASTGSILDRIPSTILAFETFAAAHPNGTVLNRDTGINRAYGQNPYPGYDNINSSPFLFRGPSNARLPPMQRVLGITIGDIHRIYPLSIFDSIPLVEDRVGGVDVVAVASGKLNSALDQSSIAASRLVNQVAVWQRRYQPSMDSMSFQIGEDGVLTDIETGSRWNAAGTAVDGPLRGQQLLATNSGVHFAFAWLAFNPDTEIYGQ